MKGIASLVVVVLSACGSVKDKTDARPPDDGATSDTIVDADIDAAIDGPPADAMRFASGSYSFEDLTAGNPTTPRTFPNMVTWAKPDPNPGDSTGVYVLDCTGDSGAFGFSCANSRAFIPNGVKSLVFPNLGGSGRFIEFTFPMDIGTFSVAVTNTGGQTGQVYRVVAMVNGIDVAMGDATTGQVSTWPNTRATAIYAPGFHTVQIRNVGAVANAVMIDEIRWTSDAP